MRPIIPDTALMARLVQRQEWRGVGRRGCGRSVKDVCEGGWREEEE